MSVRPLNEDDLPQVADLYWTVLRDRKPPVPPVVQSHPRNLYFNNPWRDRTIPSLVYDAGAGNIIVFLGAVPSRLQLNRGG